MRIHHIIFTILSIAGSLQATDLSVQDIMSPAEQENIGVNRMSPQQRVTLERWITNWTEKVLSQSSSYHKSESIPEWIAGWPKHLLPAPISKEQEIEEKRTANQNIFRNTNGETLELNDGSVWTINAIDRSIARWWKRGDPLQIRKTQRDVSRPYLLFNISNNQQVGANLAKEANAEGVRPPEPVKNYAGAVVLQSIGQDGIELTLKNGTSWKISPMYQLQVMATWTPGDRIKIESSQDALYRNKLINLDSGDSVLGNAKR